MSEYEALELNNGDWVTMLWMSGTLASLQIEQSHDDTSGALSRCHQDLSTLMMYDLLRRGAEKCQRDELLNSGKD